MKTDVVLTTINARYVHAAFGLRYLRANLGPLRERSQIIEFTSERHVLEIVEGILAASPKIVGVGVYIWNVTQSTEVIALLKRLRPDITVVLGGPEVSHEWGEQAIVGLADYVITGEGDFAFRALCEQVLSGEKPDKKIIHAVPPAMDELALPYEEYSDHDVEYRVIYIEASRGCPFRCEFCLSSLDRTVRKFSLDAFLASMQRLFDRGLRQFKFVDRTFNLDLKVSRAILEFFLERYEPGLFVHFEMVPDRLPEKLREVIRQFPPGALQFEVGIQTFSREVAARISRRQDYDKMAENFAFLKAETGVHVHADLIAGLPGETVEMFARGFDELIGLGPQEIQVGILKRLRGTPIARHTKEWEMVYSPLPPYEILQSTALTFEEVLSLRRFSQLWDRVANSGRFVRTAPLIWGDGSPFEGFMAWTHWVIGEAGQSYGIALMRMMKMLFKYLTEEREISPDVVALPLLEDYQSGQSRREVPGFLRPHLPVEKTERRRRQKGAGLPSRQARHLS